MARPTASIVFVGYQGVGTPGRRIVDGASSIRLFNEDIAIKAKVFTIGGFSAHAGQSQILDWIRKMPHSSMQVVLVHGEEKAQQTLSGLIKEEFKLPVSIPGYMEEMELVPGVMPEVVVTAKAQSYAHVDWELLLEETESKMAKLRARLENAQSRPWDEQVDIRDRVLELKGIAVRPHPTVSRTEGPHGPLLFLTSTLTKPVVCWSVHAYHRRCPWGPDIEDCRGTGIPSGHGQGP